MVLHNILIGLQDGTGLDDGTPTDRSVEGPTDTVRETDPSEDID
jgi:hypothetical protein